MPQNSPIFQGAFRGPNEADLGRGRRPVIFDILAPDQTRSLLPEDLRLVLHWGDAAESISFEAATGGFMRLYTGMSATTHPQGRRQTIAYDRYLDLLALFHNNGAIYDAFGNIAVQGYIKMSFDGGVHIGWFSSFQVTEAAEQPFMFNLSAEFLIHREIMTFRSTGVTSSAAVASPAATSAPEFVDEESLGPSTSSLDDFLIRERTGPRRFDTSSAIGLAGRINPDPEDPPDGTLF